MPVTLMVTECQTRMIFALGSVQSLVSAQFGSRDGPPTSTVTGNRFFSSFNAALQTALTSTLKDGVEDQDRDNDGIEDKVDRCPFSPKQYNFVSDSVNDFDGDGCKDGVEDSAQVGVQRAEMTRPGESSDISGCSKEQHRDLELAREQDGVGRRGVGAS
eukprot:g9810.t1